jgi:hypothetical protein
MKDPIHRIALGINTLALGGYLVWIVQTDQTLWRGSESLLQVLPLLIFFLVYIAILHE